MNSDLRYNVSLFGSNMSEILWFPTQQTRVKEQVGLLNWRMAYVPNFLKNVNIWLAEIHNGDIFSPVNARRAKNKWLP